MASGGTMSLGNRTRGSDPGLRPKSCLDEPPGEAGYTPLLSSAPDRTCPFHTGGDIARAPSRDSSDLEEDSRRVSSRSLFFFLLCEIFHPPGTFLIPAYSRQR